MVINDIPRWCTVNDIFVCQYVKSSLVSEKAGVSIITIRNFENGKLRNISMGTFIELLRAIDFMQGLDDVLPEIPVSPYELEKIQQGKRKRKSFNLS